MVLFPFSLGSNTAFNGAGPSTMSRSYPSEIRYAHHYHAPVKQKTQRGLTPVK